MTFENEFITVFITETTSYDIWILTFKLFQFQADIHSRKQIVDVISGSRGIEENRSIILNS